MYQGFMRFNGVELFNAARVEALVGALLPGVQVRCRTKGLREVLGHGAYTATTGAPWYSALTPASANFYGFFPNAFEGLEDSTLSAEAGELIGDGAWHSAPRRRSREVRIVTTAFAKDEDGLRAGMLWLDRVLEATVSEEPHLGCFGNDIAVLSALPATVPGTPQPERLRFFYRARVLRGPKLLERLPSKRGVMARYEILLSLGNPSSYTAAVPVGTLNMAGASNYLDPAGQNCSVAGDAYADFINDPFFTAIRKPPAAPIIAPPNIPKITSWRRLTVPIAANLLPNGNYTVPTVLVTAATAMQQLRLRFYETALGLTGCDYDGEFLVSYLPPGSTLRLDGVRQEAMVERADGRMVPGTHLLFGSDGLPFVWPVFRPLTAYTMTADLMPGQTGVTVALLAAAQA